MPNNKLIYGNEELNIDEDKPKQKLQLRLKNLLSLRNVSFLIGNGASMMLGAPSIRSVRQLMPDIIAEVCEKEKSQCSDQLLPLLDQLLNLFSNARGQNDTHFESLLSSLFSFQSIFQSLKECKLSYGDLTIEKHQVDKLILLMKRFLYNRCVNLPIRQPSTKDPITIEDPLTIHKDFFRKLLLRASTLPRIKIFTLNYDLIIEKALDSLGVSYFDGFSGTIDRAIQTESYNYDLYFPGETTEGNVQRVDRVLHLFKLHGSINWLKIKRTSSNIWGVKQGIPKEGQYADLMIYPSPIKEGEILGYPYSEMFRHFSFSINRPQSVLFTIGYSFNDNHINQLIYQSFSIPSFVLVIITPQIPKEENNEVYRLVHKVKSERILIITGAENDNEDFVGGAGTFQGFTNDWMPDIQELDIEKKIKVELDNLIDLDETKPELEGNNEPF